MMQLHVLNEVTGGLLNCPAERLYQYLPGPTLLDLPGVHAQPLFVSVLLHGNESTGWDAIRSWLQQHQQQLLPRRLVVLIGNVDAAREGLRRLEHQADFNRIWKGGDSPEAHMAADLLQRIAAMQPFAAIDLHNNTGSNPHYACVNKLDHAFLHLARLFSRTVVYFTTPDSVLSRAMAGFCPSLTVEAGKPGDAAGLQHCMELIDAAMHLHHFPEHPIARHEVDIFQTVAVAKVCDHVDFGVEPGLFAFSLRADLDHLNFSELPVGTSLGRFDGHDLPLTVTDESGSEVGHCYFKLVAGELHTMQPLMPSMLTMNADIIRQDCLCYLMRRIEMDDLAGEPLNC